MAARNGMSNLIIRLRGMTNAGSADYTLVGGTYWTDDQLQSALDRRSCRYNREALCMEPAYEGGTVTYTEYRFEYGDVEELESGAARWRVEQADGTNIGTADYTVSYDERRITFNADQAGTPYYLTYHRYDLERTAADIWDDKAAHVADRFDIKTDNHDLKRSQLVAQYNAQAAKWRGRAKPRTAEMVRGDVNGY